MAKNKENIEGWSSDQLINIAKWQRYVVWIVLLQMAASIGLGILSRTSTPSPSQVHHITGIPGTKFTAIIVCSFVIGILSMCCTYNLAVSLRKPMPILYALAMFLSNINLVILFLLCNEASDVLRSYGIKVNPIGISKEDLKLLDSGKQSKKIIEEWNLDQLIRIVKWKRYMILMAVLQVLAYIGLFIQKWMTTHPSPGDSYIAGTPGAHFTPILISTYAIFILSMYGIYNLVVSLRKSTSTLYVLAMIIQVVNIVISLISIGEANKVLVSSGIRVGFLGVNKEEITRFESEGRSKK